MTFDPHPMITPRYRGSEWIGVKLPHEPERWPKFRTRLQIDKTGDSYDIAEEELLRYAQETLGEGAIAWPDRTIYFLSDMHADADAFFRSLVASGAIDKTGPEDADFTLTDAAARAIFVIGGDCLDKGPHNLRLLRALRLLIDSGAEVELLVGNHDLRALVGFIYGGAKEPRLAHLFVRMGKKAIPLYKEIYDEYIAPHGPHELLSDDEVRRRLFHDESWYEAFPATVKGLIQPNKIVKEVKRIREKVGELQEMCDEMEMSLGMVYAAFQRAKELFLPGGEFAWFFERMRLCRRYGSLLFIHAGVDDVIAKKIRDHGICELNAEFRRLIDNDLFALYHGSFGNSFRTKYRPSDRPFTEVGLQAMHEAGIYAIVHGHRNILRGQRMVLRQGMLNFECDVSVDANTRALEGQSGPGGGITVIRPDGHVLGISTDHPYVKHFDVRTAFRLQRSRAGR